ncbi:MarR family winged helix-turn-helix transcriptional regulator [Lacticaseibacillus pantheris]|nr:MarR family winged helix-turn-helix transcriptional regulator [Lacticaseibacillus pantheris]WKF86106.1 MarR family winged helix-turn-helix transcriptional regulator [Lacticaseibacillus pantheris]
MFVHDNPGLSQKEIAHLMVLDPSLVGRDIQELINVGFLKRRQVQQGHLTNLIFMTSEGIALTSTIQGIIDHWWLAVFDQAVGIDKQVLTQQLEILYHQVINTGIGNKE